MKKKYKYILTLCFLWSLVVTSNGQTTAATQLANHIAQKMKDTLSLTTLQQSQVYITNINLHTQKMAIRQLYTNPDSLRIKTQQVESKRDSLYRIILPVPKYTLYLQKKRNLVSAN